MALANYSDLQSSVTDWLARSDIQAAAPDCITLAEARLNRLLGAVETDQTLTGTSGSRRIDISSLSCVEPIALFLAESGNDEVQLTPKADGTFPYLNSSGKPRYWAIDGTNIDFDRPLDAAYPFRFRFRQRFALSDSATTNWLLTNHPDVYLAAALMWGAGYVKSIAEASTWKSILDEGIPEVRRVLARNKKSVLTVDPALMPRPYYYDGREP